LAIVLPVLFLLTWKSTGNTMAKSKEKAQAIQWPSQKKKHRQYNGQVKRKSTGNTMAKSKEKGQAIQWPSQKKKNRQYNPVLFLLSWPLYCLCFVF
jgi:hypothetical protein